MIINGDSLIELKKFEDNHFDSVVCDPPYGLEFMGKEWDYDVPSVELWQEVFRVLKEGGHLLAFAGTRTQHRMAVNIEDAGFEIRDMIAWVYGSGFPKSHNIGKKIKQWEGWGTALKPALEPITMARKPFKTSVAENVLKNGVGGINIDGCRVGNKQGRFPANFIHDGSEEVKGLFPNADDKTSESRFFYCAKSSKLDRNEGLEKFEPSEKYSAGNYSQSPVCVDCHKTLNGTNNHSY